MSATAILSVKILGDAKKLASELDSAEGKVSKFGGAFKAIGGAIAALGIGAFVKDAIAGAEAAAQANAKLENILKSNVGASQAKVDAAIKSAEALAATVAVDDEIIKGGQAILGTFSEVGKSAGQVGGVFDRATAAAVDLSAAGFGSVEGSAKMLGKALNDPIKGISALGRAGVTFTDSQKDMIKAMVASGDVAGAQAIILGEVEKQVGGTAAASVTASERMKFAWGELSESIGGLLLPVFEKVAGFITDKVIPAVQGFVDYIKTGDLSGLAEAFNISPGSLDWLTGIRDKLVAFGGFVTGTLVPGIKSVVGTLIEWQGVLVPVAAGITAIVVAFQTYQAVIKVVQALTKAWMAVQITMNAVLTANPIGLIVLAIVGLVTALVVAYKKSETFRDIVNGAFNAIKGVVETVVGAIKAVWDTLFAILSVPVKIAITLITTYITGYIAVVKGVFNGIKAVWDAITGVLSGPISSAKSAISGVLSTFSGLFSSALTKIKNVWDDIKEYILGPIRAAKNAVSGILSGIGDAIRNALSGIKGILNGLISAFNKLPGPDIGLLSVTTPGGGVPDWAVPVPTAQNVFPIVRVQIAGREVEAIVSNEAGRARDSYALVDLLGAVV